MNLYLYLDKETLIHRLDPRTKIFLLMASFAFSVINNNMYVLLYILFFVLVLSFFSKAISNIRNVLAVLILVSLVSIFLWLLFGKFSHSSLLYGVTVSLKIVIMLISGIIFLSTTKNEAIVLGLRRLGLPYVASFTTSLALRLLPVFMHNVKNIYDAQRCRGVDLKRGSVLKRLKNYIPLLGPIFLVTLRSTDQLSIALESKGFGAKKRTYYISIHFRVVDIIIMAVIFLLMLLNIYYVFFKKYI